MRHPVTAVTFLQRDLTPRQCNQQENRGGHHAETSHARRRAHPRRAGRRARLADGLRPSGATLVFTAGFDALYENEIKIVSKRTGRTVHRFSNYREVRRGVWRPVRGRQSFETRAERGRACYDIVGAHKRDRPNPRLRWQRSRFVINGTRVGFEDAGDRDYNDATVRVRFGRPGHPVISQR